MMSNVPVYPAIIIFVLHIPKHLVVRFYWSPCPVVMERRMADSDNGAVSAVMLAQVHHVLASSSSTRRKSGRTKHTNNQSLIAPQRRRRRRRLNMARIITSTKNPQIGPISWNKSLAVIVFSMILPSEYPKNGGLVHSFSPQIRTTTSSSASATRKSLINRRDDDDLKKTHHHQYPPSFSSALYARSKYPRNSISFSSFSSSSSSSSHVDDYNFWEESLSIQSFNMDLQNLAMEDPQKAQDALEIMERLYQEEQSNNTSGTTTADTSSRTLLSSVVRPDSASYTTVMEGWCYGGTSMNANSMTMAMPEEEDPLWGHQSNEKKTTRVGGYASSTTTSASSSSSSETARRVQALLDRMEEAPHLQPNEVSYLLACQQWADAVADETPFGENVQRAQDLLDRLLEQQQQQQQQQQNDSSEDANDEDDYTDDGSSSTISSTSSPGNQRRRRRRKTIPISTKLYSIVMEGWCRRIGKVPRAMERVETLLKDMEDAAAAATTTAADHSLILPKPNVLTYTSVIGGLARSRQRDLATRAMALLPRMEAYGVEPDMVAYTSILNCWAKTRSRDERQQAHTQALKILQKMEDSYIATNDQDDEQGNSTTITSDGRGDPRYHLKPNAITYATAIKAIGNSFAENANALVEEVLQRMYNLTESGLLHVPPTVETYNAVIMSLSSSASAGSGSASSSSSSSSMQLNRSARARRAEKWLVEMIQRARKGEAAVAPNVRTWGAVLRAWADSGRPDAGEQAQRVLDLMEDWYQDGKSSVKPNVVCYTTVINAWARGTSTSSKVALNRVEQLLKHMEDLYEETGDPNVRPNKISYVSVMDAYSRKCKNKAMAAMKAQSIVDRMVKLYASNQGYVRPTRIVFNALINAYSKSDHPTAAAQAEKIFRWMETQYQGGDDYVKPDEITLCGVLNAWANHAADGGALRAQEILDHTESLSLKKRGFSHSIICHNILIKAWGRSREPDSVQRAVAILNKLEASCQNGNKKGSAASNIKEEDRSPSICPDVTTYSSVINCCAYYSGNEAGRREALEVALQTFAKIQNDQHCEDGPNNITFGTLLKAIAKLMPIGPERESLVQSLFEQCQSLGQVDSFVLSQVRAASSTQLYRTLVLEAINLAMEDGTSYDKILNNMPRAWRSNIVVWDG